MEFLKNIDKWGIIEPIVPVLIVDLVVNYALDPSGPGFLLKQFLTVLVFVICITETNCQINILLKENLADSLISKERQQKSKRV
ncbi:hypothetical protein [Ulvibacterium marinum]|uniref:Uncharacterized protein n=1 Tax=Ulvibacterium marinum TaxID=2419782 RepID=A0A3B0BXF3_9FLAO|nr:hypothetical protein [Ulvibacterium marinum]RKN76974.1 hypothetical protein D7Z94_24675 [Ulvibacterium marinum]